MSIAALNQVYDEVRRLAIAGSGLAAGDFRLKKLVEQLEKSAEKAPVFGKVAQAVRKVVECSDQDSAGALLELSTLTTAILYTQGETGRAGELRPVPTADLGLPASNTSARVLKPLLEALTTTGGGRLELIRDAHERGAFKDLRLVRPAVAALDDSYGEIGDFVANQVLPLYGKAVYSLVREGYDAKGKGDDARRLRVMHRLDPQTTHELVEQALEDGSKEVKLQAIECLAGDRNAIPYLLEQTRAKAKDVRAVALRGLASFPDEEVVDTLTQALGGADVGLVAGHIHANCNPRLHEFVLNEAERQRDTLLTGKSKDKAKQNSQVQQFHTLLDALKERGDTRTVDFLKGLFQEREKLAASGAGAVDGNAVVGKVAKLLLHSGAKPSLKLLVDARESVAPEHVHLAFLAAAKLSAPRQVYDQFSPLYLNRPEGKKKDTLTARQRSEHLGGLLQTIASRHPWYGELELGALAAAIELDPRWLDAAIKRNDLRTVLPLARPGHPAVVKYLAGVLDAEIKKKKFPPDYWLDEILGKLIECGYPQATDRLLAILEPAKPGRWHDRIYHVVRVIPQLPKDAAPRIEALLPKLDEKVVDYLLPYLDELKRKDT